MELKIIKENAINAYKKGSLKDKALLTNLFGADLFVFNPIEQIQTFDDVLRINGVDPEDFQLSGANLTPDEFAYRQLKEIVKAYNNGWVPDWSNNNEPKYYPWFKWNGSGFSAYDCVYGYSYSALGSRLVLKSRELAEHVVEHFIDDYRAFMVIE